MGIFGFGSKKEVKPQQPIKETKPQLTPKEAEEISHAVKELQNILDNFQNKNEEQLVIEFEHLINSLIKVRNKYLTELFGLVLVEYSALLTKDVVARLYHHQAYSDSIDRLRKVQNCLQSAVEHLDHSKNFNANKELHDRIYSEIYTLLAFNNICFRRFFQARRFAKKALSYDSKNEIAEGLILIIRDNNNAEEAIAKAIRKNINIEEMANYHELTSKLALTLVDDNDNDLVKLEESSLNSEEKQKSLKITSPVMIVRDRLNPRNWKMVQFREYNKVGLHEKNRNYLDIFSGSSGGVFYRYL